MDRFTGSNEPNHAWEAWLGALKEGDGVVIGSTAATFVRFWEDDEHADIDLGGATARVMVSDLMEPGEVAVRVFEFIGDEGDLVELFELPDDGGFRISVNSDRSHGAKFVIGRDLRDRAIDEVCAVAFKCARDSRRFDIRDGDRNVSQRSARERVADHIIHSLRSRYGWSR